MLHAAPGGHRDTKRYYESIAARFSLTSGCIALARYARLTVPDVWPNVLFVRSCTLWHMVDA
eukprot:1396030-Pleurochrysis_carterae.AAC.2